MRIETYNKDDFDLVEINHVLYNTTTRRLKTNFYNLKSGFLCIIASWSEFHQGVRYSLSYYLSRAKWNEAKSEYNRCGLTEKQLFECMEVITWKKLGKE